LYPYKDKSQEKFLTNEVIFSQILDINPKNKGASKNCFCYENVRNFPRLWRKVKFAAGIAKAMSRTQFGLTTQPVKIAAVCSKNEFFEVPTTFNSRYYLTPG
jgi:hypothetical protein